MEKMMRWMKKQVMMSVFFSVLAMLIFSDLALASDPVTAKLNITPSPAKKGDALKFSATIYNNPAVGLTPGATYSCSVVLDNTQKPELSPWSTESKTFKYPPPEGRSVTLNFTSNYTVPSNVKDLCFYLWEENGKKRLSYKTCIQVTTPLVPLKVVPKTGK